MIIYIFQCYSLKSPHPCLLPQSPKVCSLHLCLLCCLAIESLLPSFLSLISLLFNMLSRLVIAFLPKSRGLLISWLQLWPLGGTHDCKLTAASPAITTYKAISRRKKFSSLSPFCYLPSPLVKHLL